MSFVIVLVIDTDSLLKDLLAFELASKYSHPKVRLHC